LAVITALFTAVLFLPLPLSAGDLEPPPEAWDSFVGEPLPTSSSLGQIYTKTVTSINNVTRFPQCQNVRFLDLLDGTVADCKTGLIWLQYANLSGAIPWELALSYCSYLKEGINNLTDGSKSGDWRLPTIRELESLVDYNYDTPALSNAKGNAKCEPGDCPFIAIFNNVNFMGYAAWSATTKPDYTTNAYRQIFWYPCTESVYKGNTGGYAWCVKGGP
jgi:hypothetical protein